MVLKWSLVGGWVACIHHPIPLVGDPLPPPAAKQHHASQWSLVEVGISAHSSTCSVVTMPLCPQCNSFMLRMQSSCWRVDHLMSVSLSHFGLPMAFHMGYPLPLRSWYLQQLRSAVGSSSRGEGHTQGAQLLRSSDRVGQLKLDRAAGTDWITP